MKQSKVQRWLLIGILGGALSFLGDLFLGWMVYPETGNFYTALIASCGDLSDLRLGLGGFFGAAGIPLSFFGFWAIGVIISESSPKHAKLVQIGAASMAFWGAAVHLMCTAAMFLLKTEANVAAGSTILEAIPERSLAFLIYIVLPVTLLLMIPYAIACVLIFINIAAGRTSLPRWICVFNPLIFKVVINLLSNIGINNCVFNGIHMSNMSFGALVTFSAVLLSPKSNPKLRNFKV